MRMAKPRKPSSARQCDSGDQTGPSLSWGVCFIVYQLSALSSCFVKPKLVQAKKELGAGKGYVANGLTVPGFA